MSEAPHGPAPETMRAAVLAAFPELAEARFSVLAAGWDNLALDVDDRLIFRFPRHAQGERSLAREARLLDALRPAVRMPVPALTVHPGPPPFSRHPKLAGGHLLTSQYARLPAAARDRLAADMALFYAQLHRLDAQAMQAAGAGPVSPWMTPDEILRLIRPLLPQSLRGHAERTIEAWARLPPEPLGTVYGFFDGHGWNMAFDHAAQRLNGLYDFIDSGFGPRHQEFIYTDFVARDLTARIVEEYERLTGLALDRERIELLSGAHRLWELAGQAHLPDQLPAMLGFVQDWLADRRR